MTNSAFGFNAPGTIAPIFEKPEYLSERGFPLVTQYLQHSSFEGNPEPHLTVENYEKWYSMYIIHHNGIIRTLDDFEEPDYGVSYCNHAFNPSSFHKTALKHGLKYDNRTFALVCERWVSEVLEDDWTLLHKYLPAPGTDEVTELIDTTIDELKYALHSDDKSNQQHYIENSTRFLKDALKLLHTGVK